jgi:hypothetical protein
MSSEIKYVTIQKLAEDTGYTVGALRRKIERGQFIEGVHFKHSPDGRIQFNLEAYNQWVEGVKVELRHAA